MTKTAFAAVNVQPEGELCPGCGKTFTESAMTGCYLDGYGMAGGALVYGGGDKLHLHGVTIAGPDALTVRHAVRRLAHMKRLRVARRLRLARAKASAAMELVRYLRSKRP